MNVIKKGNIGQQLDFKSLTYSIINSISDALLITDVNNKILIFNNTFIQFWQFPEETINSYDRDKIFGYLDTKVESKNYFTQTFNYLKNNNEEAIFNELIHINGSIIECYTLPRWANNKIIGRLWSFRDITQQKYAEKTLVTQKQELINAHRIASMGSWVYNIQSKEFKWSESFSQLCNGLLVHKSFKDFLKVVFPEDKKRVQAFFKEVILKDGRESYELKYRVITKDNEIYHIKNIVELEFLNNEPTRLLGISQDVTRQAFLETSLASAKEAAEDYMIAKDNIFSNISHEMRTPLNAILGYVRILSQITGDDRQKDYLDSIKTSSESLLGLIEDVLYLSEVEGKKIKLKSDEVNIKELADELYQLFYNRFRKKKLNFNIKVKKDVPKYVIIDRTRIKQILINLISNGLKFTNKGSVLVEIEVRNGIKNNRFDLLIYVEDTGIGIEEKEQAKIFDSFHQVDYEDKKSYEGIGLGLYTTKKNVELLGGDIKVNSSPAKGSVFIVTIPNVKILSSSLNLIEKNYYQIENLQFEEASILVADDNDFNKEILRYVLSKFNFEIFEVENGERAVHFAKKFMPSLIIMDLKMPKMDGYEALKVIKKDPEVKSIPVIAFSSNSPNIDKKNLIEIGFDDFLSKPVTFSKTIKLLTKYIRYQLLSEISEKKGNDCHLENELKELFKNKNLTNTFRENLSVLWQNLLDKKTSKNQKAFAQKLLKFGSTNNLPCITKMANSLILAQDVFDVDEIEKIMEKLKQVFSEVDKL